MVSKIQKYITDTKYCSDLGFNNCTVKKKVKWFQMAELILHHLLIVMGMKIQQKKQVM